MTKKKNYTLTTNIAEVNVIMVDGLKNKEECWGQFSDEDGVATIELDSSLKGIPLRNCLNHEVFHMVLHMSGIAFLLEDKYEEAIVRALENIYLPLVPAVDELYEQLSKK